MYHIQSTKTIKESINMNKIARAAMSNINMILEKRILEIRMSKMTVEQKILEIAKIFDIKITSDDVKKFFEEDKEKVFGSKRPVSCHMISNESFDITLIFLIINIDAIEDHDDYDKEIRRQIHNDVILKIYHMYEQMCVKTKEDFSIGQLCLMRYFFKNF